MPQMTTSTGAPAPSGSGASATQLAVHDPRPFGTRPLFKRGQDGYTTAWRTVQLAPAGSAHAVDIALNVPVHGVVFMDPPEDARAHAAAHGLEPTWDHLLSGEAVFTLPPGHAPVRYSAIRVGFYSLALLDMGKGRESEVDELFRREIATAEGGVLEDTLRFDFTLIIPSTLAPRDGVGNNSITTNLFAEIVGADVPQTSTSPPASPILVPSSSARAGLSSRRHASQGRIASRGRSASRDRRAGGSSLLGMGTLSRSLMSLTRRDAEPPARGRASPRPGLQTIDDAGEAADGGATAVAAAGAAAADAAADADADADADGIPRPPGYAAPDAAEWLQGPFRAEKVIRLIYNPNPLGGITELDEHFRGEIGGLGQFDIRLYSDVWSIATMLRATLVLSDLPPTATVFSFRVHLDQTHEVRSPRDAAGTAPLVVKRRFLLVEQGVAPDTRHVVPAANAPALWRGRAAGGTDDGVLMAECQDRVMRDDLVARPSTPATVKSPIHVSHSFVVVVYFSTWGMDAYGKPLRGPGALRELRITRPTVLPTCALVPRAVNLPDYEHPEQWAGSNDPDRPWNKCACEFSDAAVADRMRAALKRQETMAREHETAGTDSERAKAELLARG